MAIACRCQLLRRNLARFMRAVSIMPMRAGALAEPFASSRKMWCCTGERCHGSQVSDAVVSGAPVVEHGSCARNLSHAAHNSRLQRHRWIRMTYSYSDETSASQEHVICTKGAIELVYGDSWAPSFRCRRAKALDLDFL